MGYSQGLDLTTGRPMHKIGLFALPVIIGNLVQECYNLADTLIVGQTLGVEKLAAVGSTGSLTFLISGLIIGLTSG